MNVKLFEVRDAATFIPVFAFRARPVAHSNEPQRYLLARTGYGPRGDSHCVIVGYLRGGEVRYDPYDWTGGARTMTVAHAYIEEHFDTLQDGDVIDVQFILKETTEPKASERVSHPDSAGW